MTKKQRTVSARKAQKTVNKKSPKKPAESDGAFFLKIVLFLVVSSFWVRIQFNDGSELPLPVGALLAVMYALHEHFQIDRKIELALILVALFISFWLPVGLYISA